MILVAFLSLAFGITSKIADLFNDHGLVVPRWISICFGVLWGSIGSMLCLLYPVLMPVYISSVLYWFLRIKLAHTNHAIAGILILLAGYFVGRTVNTNYIALVGLFIWLTVTGYAQDEIKKRLAKNQVIKKFFRLRIRYYIGPIIYSLYIKDPNPSIAIAFGMIGTEAITYLWERISLNNQNK